MNTTEILGKWVAENEPVFGIDYAAWLIQQHDLSIYEPKDLIELIANDFRKYIRSCDWLTIRKWVESYETKPENKKALLKWLLTDEQYNNAAFRALCLGLQQ